MNATANADPVRREDPRDDAVRGQAVSVRRRKMFMHFSRCTLPLAGVLLISGCIATKATRFDTIAIRGRPEFRGQVANALALLKSKAPGAYATITNEIGIIEQAKRSGMRAWLNPPKFELADGTAFYSLTWCAGSIAHDSFHSKLYHDYLKQNSKARRVPDGVWTSEEAENRCSEHQLAVLKEIGAPFHEIDWCRQTNRYWQVKYRDRFW